MPVTRHLGAGLTLLVALGAFAGLQVLTPGVLAGQSKERYPAAGGDLEITAFIHNSLQLEHQGLVVHIDPWSVADLSLAKPADLILITDDPAHHLDPEAIKRLRKPGAPVVTPPNGRAKVPDGVVLQNGESSVQAGIKIEAIAAYDLTPGEPYHPKGESNGYVITLGGKRVFVVGITECVPEVRAVRDVDVAFMPLSLPVGRMAAPGSRRMHQGAQAQGGVSVPLRPGLRDQHRTRARRQLGAPWRRGIRPRPGGRTGAGQARRLVSHPRRPHSSASRHQIGCQSAVVLGASFLVLSASLVPGAWFESPVVANCFVRTKRQGPRPA